MSGEPGSAPTARALPWYADGSHQHRVASTFPFGSPEWWTAMFHDHLEDGIGDVPEEVRSHVEVLTRGIDEDYRAYVERVRDSGDSVAVAVKLADARDNLARCRGEHDGFLSSNRGRRYEYAIARLSSVSDEGATEGSSKEAE